MKAAPARKGRSRACAAGTGSRGRRSGPKPSETTARLPIPSPTARKTRSERTRPPAVIRRARGSFQMRRREAAGRAERGRQRVDAAHLDRAAEGFQESAWIGGGNGVDSGWGGDQEEGAHLGGEKFNWAQIGNRHGSQQRAGPAKRGMGRGRTRSAAGRTHSICLDGDIFGPQPPAQAQPIAFQGVSRGGKGVEAVEQQRERGEKDEPHQGCKHEAAADREADRQDQASRAGDKEEEGGGRLYEQPAAAKRGKHDRFNPVGLYPSSAAADAGRSRVYVECSGSRNQEAGAKKNLVASAVMEGMKIRGRISAHCAQPSASVLKIFAGRECRSPPGSSPARKNRPVHPPVVEHANLEQREVFGAGGEGAQQFRDAEGDKGHRLGKRECSAGVDPIQ